MAKWGTARAARGAPKVPEDRQVTQNAGPPDRPERRSGAPLSAQGGQSGTNKPRAPHPYVLRSRPPAGTPATSAAARRLGPSRRMRPDASAERTAVRNRPGPQN